MSNLIAITGPTYSGKTTLINHLMEDYNYVVPRHITTRKERIDDEPGLLYPPEDYKLLAESIIKLYQNKELAKKMGINGRKEILNKYSPDKIAKKNIKIYQEAIKDYNEKKNI